MIRTILILAFLVSITSNFANAVPIFIKAFGSNEGYISRSAGAYQSSATSSVINTQLISNLISTKLQLLNSVLQTKSSGGEIGFGLRKFISISSAPSTTETPITPNTTEVKTNFTPDDSTTETTIETKPTVRPQPPVTTSSAPVNNSTIQTTSESSGYNYVTPTTGAIVRPTVDTHY